MENKMTKRETYEKMLEILTEKNVDSIFIDFVAKQIELLDNRAAKAKERAEEKKLEGDALRELVLNSLTDEYQTVNEIVEKVVASDAEATNAKVISRLSTLVGLGLAEKTKGVVEGKLKTSYKLAEVKED